MAGVVLLMRRIVPASPLEFLEQQGVEALNKTVEEWARSCGLVPIGFDFQYIFCQDDPGPKLNDWIRHWNYKREGAWDEARLLHNIYLTWYEEREQAFALDVRIGADEGFIFAKVNKQTWETARRDFEVLQSHVIGLANEALKEKESYMQKLSNLELLRALSGHEFENIVAMVFEERGYKVHRTKASGDEGVDLFISKHTETSIVQCKNQKKAVGQPQLRDLYGALIHSKASRAYLICTSDFSPQARRFAEGKPIELVNGLQFADWLKDISSKISKGHLKLA